MRLWNSKTHSEDANWSVVLNPLRSELDKNRVAQKISDLFHLAFEESRELVQNTPIILLDELTEPAASRLKGIFEESRADVMLTNDSLVKRRCFRAVWPELPSLAFLESVPETNGPEPERESVVEQISVRTTAETLPSPPPPRVNEETEELRRRLQELEGGHRTSELRFQELEKKHRELQALHEEKVHENRQLKQTLDKELKEHADKANTRFRTTVEEWEERYQSLKEESQESRKIYEEKLHTNQKELESVKAKLKDLSLWHEKALGLEKQVKGFQERVNLLESTKETLERSVKERSDEVGLWKERSQSMAEKAERFETLYEEERKRREEAQSGHQQAVSEVDRIRREIEAQVIETERWRKKSQELEENQRRLEKEFAEYSEDQESEIKRLREGHQELEGQLALAQRQTKDLLTRAEQHELIEKRERLNNELTLKEAKLREFVIRRERLREEAQERELQAESIASEQANLEREILDIKQAQRHLLEQSKLMEKNHRAAKRPQQPHQNLSAGEPV